MPRTVKTGYDIFLVQQLAEARKLSDNEVRQYASIDTSDGTYNYNDTSFVQACETVRCERGLPRFNNPTK